MVSILNVFFAGRWCPGVILPADAEGVLPNSGDSLEATAKRSKRIRYTGCNNEVFLTSVTWSYTSADRIWTSCEWLLMPQYVAAHIDARACRAKAKAGTIQSPDPGPQAFKVCQLEKANKPGSTAGQGLCRLWLVHTPQKIYFAIPPWSVAELWSSEPAVTHSCGEWEMRASQEAVFFSIMYCIWICRFGVVLEMLITVQFNFLKSILAICHPSDFWGPFAFLVIPVQCSKEFPSYFFLPAFAHSCKWGVLWP